MTNLDSFESETNLFLEEEQAESEGGRDRKTLVRDGDGLVETRPNTERAILVGVDLTGAPSLLTLEDSLTELALLAKTAGVSVIGRLTQRLNTPHSATFIGSGKLEELQAMALEQGANLVIFDDELSPRQQRELEKCWANRSKYWIGRR